MKYNKEVDYSLFEYLQTNVRVESAELKWFRERLISWAENNLRDYPWRRTCEPYSILIAEFLLQRTNADKVVPIYRVFLERYPTVEKLAIAEVEALARLLKPLGLFSRAERLSQTAKMIVGKHRGKIPDSEAELMTLPGIGRYTARAICSQAFGKPSGVLDTNVARILERFFGIEGGRVKSRCKILWSEAEAIAPNTEVGRWNLTLLDFGAIICTARNPQCPQCPLSPRCHWFNLYV